MNKAQIKKLAEKSYKNNTLDEKLVKEVAKRVKRSELKNYLRELYILENRKIVKVFLPSEEQDNMKELLASIRKIYPGKKITIGVDPNLIMGIRIENEDDIFELSLKNVFEGLIKHIEQKYD